MIVLFGSSLGVSDANGDVSGSDGNYQTQIGLHHSVKSDYPALDAWVDQLDTKYIYDELSDILAPESSIETRFESNTKNRRSGMPETSLYHL